MLLDCTHNLPHVRSAHIIRSFDEGGVQVHARRCCEYTSSVMCNKHTSSTGVNTSYLNDDGVDAMGDMLLMMMVLPQCSAASTQWTRRDPPDSRRSERAVHVGKLSSM
jgi:hypothetical protein